MRVLVVTDWPAVEGGAEIQVERLVTELRAAGDEVVLLTSDRGRGVDVGDVSVRSFDAVPAAAVTQVVNPFASLAVRRVVSSFRPDVAFVSLFELYLSSSAVAGLGAVPYLLDVVWYKLVCPTGHKLLPSGELCGHPMGRVCREQGCLGHVEAVRSRVRYARLRRVVASASGVVTCSAWLVDQLARDGITATHVPMPVDRPSAEFARRPADRPLFVVAGRLSREKGLDTLLDALELLDRRGVRPTLRVVGEGPLGEMLVQRAAGTRTQIDWVGRVPHDEVERHFADAWAVVAPSRWAEPFGLTAAEAIIRGVPVVASATGGYAETVVDGVTGLLFPNGDAAALADRLEAVATRAAFPALAVPTEASAVLAEKHAPAAYLRTIRRLLEAKQR